MKLLTVAIAVTGGFDESFVYILDHLSCPQAISLSPTVDS